LGDLIDLTARRRTRAAHLVARRAPRAPIARRRAGTFWFDLSCPFTYLAAERVERQFPGIAWRPVSADALFAGSAWREPAALRAAAETRAALLRMPLVWPDPLGGDPRPAMRAAACASDRGAGAAFVLAASRLAYCGGFDLADPEVLAEAAAAANIGLDACLEAAHDVSRDGDMEADGRRLLAWGATALPAVQIGPRLFCGEERIAEAAAVRGNGFEPVAG
jgi:2-hydroxychromene-2-carboxylate isomerase